MLLQCACLFCLWGQMSVSSLIARVTCLGGLLVIPSPKALYHSLRTPTIISELPPLSPHVKQGPLFIIIVQAGCLYPSQSSSIVA